MYAYFLAVLYLTLMEGLTPPQIATEGRDRFATFTATCPIYSAK